MDMRAIAKQLKTKQISPDRVVFEFEGERWVFNNPQVMEANMMGNIVYQVVGTPEVAKDSNEEDLELIMQKTGCNLATAKEALAECGDVAEAIVHIME